MSQSKAKVSWFNQLMMAALLLSLGTFAAWVQYKHKPKQEKEKEQSKKLFQLTSSPVKSIQLVDGGKTIELSCLDASSQLCKPGDRSKWELTVPMKSRADDSNANQLLSSLENLTATEIISLSEETAEKRATLLKDYGLDPTSRAAATARKVVVKDSTGQWVAYLGVTHPFGENLFVLRETPSSIDESKVYLVPNRFKDHFNNELTFWRDKKLFTVDTHEVESFTLESKKVGKIQGIRKNGAWSLITSSHGEVTGDIENIDGLLAAATALSAKKVVSENKNDPKSTQLLKRLQNSLTLTLNKAPANEKEKPIPIVLKLFTQSKEESLYASISTVDPLYEMDAQAKDRLDKGVKDLRLVKLITSMERFSAKKLSFSGKSLGNEPMVLVNTNGKWLIEKTQTEAQPDKVQTLLEKLSGNRIQDFIASSQAKGSPKDGIEITLSDEKNIPKRHFIFWKNGGKLYARDLLSSSPRMKEEVLLVDSTIQDGLPWTADFFKKPQ